MPFLIFFIILLAFLHLVKNSEWRKGILLFASYIFYMWWNPALISLIIISTIVDYFVGIEMDKRPDRKKMLLILSLFINLGLLAFFKYANFFQDNLIYMLGLFGKTPNWTHLNIILPVGISLYTFQTMSYSIDRYKGKIDVCRSPLDFALFVSFFPQLVAGPIVRASDFIVQLKKPQPLQLDQEAGFRILRGLFKKVIIADNLGIFVDSVMSNPNLYSSIIIWFAMIAFLFRSTAISAVIRKLQSGLHIFWVTA